ncbi:PREDICTED: zinc finger A20 and AN1 domain-containing stress-associated protein 4-like [Ipomoea nil]|uniref:zinc finger A20 and AN1 domain-containing stress-associated protein 4-like n=1 Tax=Ipomoea nil TaxID=35883 RepID=UPI000901C44C|nr:PREDICTED: zinc finger A20 and AN1 domain-containing stress-associated protein 4-like [Ipomoea nil]XP_019192534.1 PREDICTED: zinc finger A20 and AN1 domain-containing stress-associated protein 4-like [Ipomoea nil]
MAEEQKCQKAGGHSLCANNCGFFGSSTTLNLCSKCYKDHCIKEQQMKEAHLAMEGSLKGRNSSESSSSSYSSSSSAAAAVAACDGSSRQEEVGSEEAMPAAAAPPPRPNRCGTCRKRVGLTGFKCRCGVIYCGTHRYPEQHGCTFDYKAMGREAIAKANPLVKAEKLDKI